MGLFVCQQRGRAVVSLNDRRLVFLKSGPVLLPFCYTFVTLFPFDVTYLTFV
jgi:hypothetical protein